MLCWYFRPTLRVMFWWAYLTSNIVVSGCHIKIILLNVAYIRSSLVAYIATQHAQHAVRRQFRYPTSPPTLGVSKVNSSKWLNCSSEVISLSLSGAELFATDSQLTCQEIASRSKQAHFFTGTNNATPTLFSNLFMGTRVPNPATWMCSSYFSLGSSRSTASNHFCLLPAYPREHCTFQMPKNELTLPRGGCSPPLIISPRTALITVAPILDRSLPTVYQLIAQHSLLRS